LLVAALSLLATSAQAVPVSFQFSTVIDSVVTGFPTGGGPPAVPAPFADSSSLLGQSITGSFTIETDVATFPAEDLENGEFITLGLEYWNPVLQFDLTVAGQQFSFVSSHPPVESGVMESFFDAIDLQQPRSEPTMNHDQFVLDTIFGAGQFAAPFAGLTVSASLIRTEFDLSAIQSTDMLSGLTTTPRWDFAFSFLDPETSSDYQVQGIVTNLRQASEVPEPGTVTLLILGLGMLGLRRRDRLSSV
jgi:hypothetical protein